MVPVDRMKQKLFSDHDKTSPSIAAVSAPSILVLSVYVSVSECLSVSLCMSLCECLSLCICLSQVNYVPYRLNILVTFTVCSVSVCFLL